MEMPGNPEIMCAIRDGLNGIKDTSIRAREDAWTCAVLTKLCEIGHQFGCKVGTKNGNYGADFKEPNCDVIWRRYNGDRLIGVPLVGGCKWGSHDAAKKYFDKLLLKRAGAGASGGVGLMIYSYYDGVKGLIKGPGPQKQALRVEAARAFAVQLAGNVKAFKFRRQEDDWLFAGGVWHGNPWCRYFTINQAGRFVPF